jgi:tetratricopeptide (TPR) repeat protein
LGLRNVRNLANAGRTLQAVALTELVANRFAAREKAYTDSMAACTAAVERDAECIARAQVGLAFALAAQEKFDDAVSWYGRSLISFNQLKMEEAGARARLGLAEALYGRGDFEKALEQAAAARRTAVALGAEDVLWRALVAAARTERKLGKFDVALDSARAAVLTVQKMAAAALEKPAAAAPADTA